MSDEKSNKLNRRQFMGGMMAAGAAYTIVPRYVLGDTGHTPPSEKLNIAAIGAGGMGATNIEAVSSENIVALCDVDEERAAQTFNKYPQARKYKDFRKMLEKEKNIDAVIVATPDHTHAAATMMAIKLGKHVYCQKPLTHTVYEARRVTEAARDAKVATQMGNQGHSSEGVRLICEWIRDGAIGPVREVHCWTDRPLGYWPVGIDRPKDTPAVPATLDWDLWVGPALKRAYHPAYAPFKWRGWWDFGCGALGDMGCHVMDGAFSALKLNYPVSIEASSTPVNSDSEPVAAIVHYQFPQRADMPAVKLHWYNGGLMPARPEELEPGRKLPESGSIFVGDKGKIMCGCYSDSPRIIPEEKMKAYPQPAKTIPRIAGTHEQNWIDACKGGEPACSNFDYAGLLTEVVLLGNIAIRTGEKLNWDGPGMKCTNVPKANEYVHAQYRDGWTL
ncbi:MAG TPA: Gfo/Idh/MocA family oxidoreductase [Sedimentisphaerales bacterium]|nr:Gfo/Idh/MocA family oxidoreductase [Sedimentisphaerales bacterium]